MPSNQPDCLTSLVSYVPQLNFGFNLPSTAAVNQLGIPAANQEQQSIPTPAESLTFLETVSTRVNCNCKCIPQLQTSSQPLRSALKKTFNTKPGNKVDEECKNTEKGCEEKRILVSKRPTEIIAKAEKHQQLPARLLQRKKTVAFGRTVNVSQTIEGTSKTHRKFLVDSNPQKKIFPKMAMDSRSERLLDEFEKLKEKVREMQSKIDELTVRDSERSGQFLKLTEAMKKMLDGSAQFNNLSSNSNENSKRCGKRFETEMRCHGKENIPPDEISVAGHITEGAAHGELFAESVNRKKTIGGPSEEDPKWTIMKRKYAENEEFKRLVDEAIMKCGGDESLDIFASHQNKGDIGRVPSRRHEKPQPISPVIRSTTRVTKQMTVEQIQRCENSPASCAFSYDSKKYLARHGIIPALSDDDEVEHNMECGKRLNPSMQSFYYPGDSVTYYSKNIKCSNMPLKDNSKNDYREKRCHHKEERTPRFFDEANYQMDQFDSDDDEDVNDMIEISDGLGVEDHCGTGIMMRLPHDKKGWRGSAHSGFRHQKNDGMCQYTKQRLNKSAWD
ncbi:hypothetical protein LOAG_08607 [Loa loa]|uniref:Uncharacterized protein n=1 Tax=Loa loa TaxID=7209 RepID=A0A1I7VR11_LOALO|nr:hypothetical protein LOAG_08607 [Loa loa]EFO19885.1 hypothetical protein LOAG_08607 [Loa loa]